MKTEPQITITIPRLCVSISELSAMLGRSQSTIKRAVRDGRMPPPILWFGGNLWRVKEVQQWVDFGMPPMTEFRLIQNARQAKSKSA